MDGVAYVKLIGLEEGRIADLVIIPTQPHLIDHAEWQLESVSIPIAGNDHLCEPFLQFLQQKMSIVARSAWNRLLQSDKIEWGGHVVLCDELEFYLELLCNALVPFRQGHFDGPIEIQSVSTVER